MVPKTTSEATGRLWGERARDWAFIQEGQCREVYKAVLAKLKLGAGMGYLDAGCGAGMAAEMAAATGAQVSGVDASEEFLAIARTRVPGGDLRQGDLGALPFADSTFDAVTGFNSFQFAADPAAALTEAKRVARPGATVVIMTWGEPAGMEAARLAVALKALLPPLPPDTPGPFALSDEAKLKALAGRAGLTAIEVLDVACPWQYANLETAVRGLDSTGIASLARAHSGDAAVSDAHAKALAEFRCSDGSYTVAASFRCLFTVRT